MRAVKRLSVSMLTLLLSFAFVLDAPKSQAQTGDKVAERWYNNVVMLEVRTVLSNGVEKLKNGFGFVVGEQRGKLYVVTPKHVVREDSPDVFSIKVQALFYQNRGEPISSKLLNFEYPGVDLALLEILKPFDSYSWEKRHYYPTPKRGEKVWFIGRNKKWWVPTDSLSGSISKPPIKGELFVEISSIKGGSSGAPLFTEKGLVGMVIKDDVTVTTIPTLGIDLIRQIVSLEWKFPWGLKKYEIGTDYVDKTVKTETSPVGTVQRELKRLGFYFGEVDGKWGPMSKQAAGDYAEMLGRNLAAIFEAGEISHMKKQQSGIGSNIDLTNAFKGFSCDVSSYGSEWAKQTRELLSNDLYSKYGCSTPPSTHMLPNYRGDFHTMESSEGPWKGFAYTSMVLYYDSTVRRRAEALARDLSNKYRHKIIAKRGAGQGIKKDHYGTAIIIHLRERGF